MKRFRVDFELESFERPRPLGPVLDPLPDVFIPVEQETATRESWPDPFHETGGRTQFLCDGDEERPCFPVIEYRRFNTVLELEFARSPGLAT